MYFCASCKTLACSSGDFSSAPKNCPSLDSHMEKIKQLYEDKENYTLAKASAIVVSDHYGSKTRLEETMDFAKECGYQNLGLAFCIGLANKAYRICSQGSCVMPQPSRSHLSGSFLL